MMLPSLLHLHQALPAQRRWLYTIISSKSVRLFASINLQHSYKLVAPSNSPVFGHIQCHKN